MTPFAGTDVFPDDVTIPDDPDEDKAANFDPGYEGALNRTIFLYNRLVRLPALSWEPLSADTQDLIAAAWDSLGAVWWACGPTTNDTVALSLDNGARWTTVVPGASGITLTDIASDSAGSLVTTAPGPILYERNGATNVWTTHAAALAVSNNHTEVVWEPVSGLWYIETNNSALSAQQVYTSPDRAVWSNQTAHLPLGFVNAGGLPSVQAHIGVGGGNVVAAWFHAGNSVITTALGSAPTVWTAIATVVPVMSTPSGMSDPVYIPSKNRWLFTIFGLNAGTPATEVYKSDDSGLTWGLFASLGGTTSSIQIVQLAVLDRLVVGVGNASVTDRIIYSDKDYGATWYLGPCINTTAATAASIAAGDGGLLYLDTGGASAGTRGSVRAGVSNRQAVLP